MFILGAFNFMNKYSCHFSKIYHEFYKVFFQSVYISLKTCYSEKVKNQSLTFVLKSAQSLIIYDSKNTSVSVFASIKEIAFYL